MIIRNKRTCNFTVIPNHVIEDPDLDWKDLGLLVYLLSKPDNWRVSVKHLMTIKKLSRDGLYRCLDTIVKSGYANQKKNKDGTVDWTIFDEKQEKFPDTENPEKGLNSLIRKIRNTEKPDMENPDVLIKTDLKQELNIKTNTEKSIVHAGQSDDLFNRFYYAYPRKVGKEAAKKAWSKLNATDKLTQKIIDTVNFSKANDSQWIKDNGQFIPHPATYLNGKRWEDEINLSKNTGHHDARPNQPKTSTITARAERSAGVANYFKSEIRSEFAESKDVGNFQQAVGYLC